MLATYPAPITIAQLLTHTAGLDEIRPGTQGPDSASVLPLADFLRPRLVRVREPGALIAYSTYGITLAGELIEEVSGLSFERYLADNIWRPLRMERTSITVPTALKADVAMGYEYVNGAQHPEPWEWYHTTPGSSINSTAADMARWMLMHLQYGRLDGATVLSEQAARDMQRQHPTGHPKVAGFAYGFNENIEPGYPRFLEHGGKMAGFSAEVLLIPERHAGFFLIHQGERANIGDPLKWALLDRFYDNPGTRLHPAAPRPTFNARALQFVGRYAWDVWCRSCPQVSVSNVLTVAGNPEGTQSIAGRKWVEVEPLYFVREDGRRRWPSAPTARARSSTSLRAGSGCSSGFPRASLYLRSSSRKQPGARDLSPAPGPYPLRLPSTSGSGGPESSPSKLIEALGGRPVQQRKLALALSHQAFELGPTPGITSRELAKQRRATTDRGIEQLVHQRREILPISRQPRN